MGNYNFDWQLLQIVATIAGIGNYCRYWQLLQVLSTIAGIVNYCRYWQLLHLLSTTKWTVVSVEGVVLLEVVVSVDCCSVDCCIVEFGSSERCIPNLFPLGPVQRGRALVGNTTKLYYL